MNTVIACLLTLCILPVACSWISGYYRRAQLGSIDNKEPRLQSAQLTGAGARAVAAQANSWEALAIFMAAVVALAISGVDLAQVANLALTFTVLRALYIAFYIGNLDTLRSLTFIGGFGICIYLFYTALTH